MESIWKFDENLTWYGWQIFCLRGVENLQYYPNHYLFLEKQFLSRSSAELRLFCLFILQFLELLDILLNLCHTLLVELRPVAKIEEDLEQHKQGGSYQSLGVELGIIDDIMITKGKTDFLSKFIMVGNAGRNMTLTCMVKCHFSLALHFENNLLNNLFF